MTVNDSITLEKIGKMDIGRNLDRSERSFFVYRGYLDVFKLCGNMTLLRQRRTKKERGVAVK